MKWQRRVSVPDLPHSSRDFFHSDYRERNIILWKFFICSEAKMGATSLLLLSRPRDTPPGIRYQRFTSRITAIASVVSATEIPSYTAENSCAVRDFARQKRPVCFYSSFHQERLVRRTKRLITHGIHSERCEYTIPRVSLHSDARALHLPTV